MAQIDPGALIRTHIVFARSSDDFDSEKQSMMRPAVKNCTVLVSSTYNTDEALTAVREQEDETVSNSSSDLDTKSTDSIPPSASTGLRMIQMAYGRQKRSPSSHSPPAAMRSVKRIKLSLSSASSSRSSSVSSISAASAVANSNAHLPSKNYVISESQQKATGRYLNNTYFAHTNASSSMSKLPKQPVRDAVDCSDKLAKKPGAVSLFGNGDGTSHLASPVANYADYEARPSTSKSFLPEAAVNSPNGAIKRRLGILEKYALPSKNVQQSQGHRTLNGKIMRKRLLSERAEREAKYPVIDRRVLNSTWLGSSILLPDGRNAGVGLFNHTNDCFLNVVLQLMVHTPPLARFVAEQHPSFSCAPDCIICALGMHVRRAITSQAPFKASWIHPYLKKIFPSHCPGFQEDAHELFNLLLDALDSAASNGSTSCNGTGNQLHDPRPSTPVEQIFGGTVRNQIRCLNCSEILINYERIRELNLGLRMRNREGPICMDDLLSDYFGTETLGNFDCKKCKRKTQIQRSSRILRAPFVLLVQLKRFNSFGAKIRLPVNVEMTLPLDSYMYNSAEPHIYRLNGLVEHQGAGLDHGHYVAAVRGFDGNGWYFFDDDVCHKMSTEEVQKRQAYLLLYIRQEVEPDSFADTHSGQRRGSPKNRIIKRPFAQSFPYYR